MNIDYEENGYRFTTRVSAIIYNKDKTKVLLCRGEDRDYYMLPGGRIEHYEDSKTAINREIEEELGFELNYKLISIQENFVTKNDIKITQYAFCYESVYKGKLEQGEFTCIDNPWQLFRWVDIDKINEIKILPSSTKALIYSKTDRIMHIIEGKED